MMNSKKIEKRLAVTYALELMENGMSIEDSVNQLKNKYLVLNQEDLAVIEGVLRDPMNSDSEV